MKKNEEKDKDGMEGSMLQGTPGYGNQSVGYKFICNTCKIESELFWQHSECIAKCKEHIKSTGHKNVHVFPCYIMES